MTRRERKGSRRSSRKRIAAEHGIGKMKIAAIALEAGAIVVTHNVRDFNRIPGVRVEDWAGT